MSSLDTSFSKNDIDVAAKIPGWAPIPVNHLLQIIYFGQG